MNEKIKELALDAGIGFVLWDDSGREMIDNYTPEEYLEKFAELIVRECALLCISRPGPGDDLRSREHCSEQIKQHFGVEE